jgi:hypothetical protein
MSLAGSYNHCELCVNLCDQYQEEKSIVLQEGTGRSKVQRRLNDILAETQDEEE